ncbi:hypothetical protein [uncultured Lacinutrix sp.]|uniref:COG3904 family protein n=1 Tax=uncultured Lacinutrix sp. TaxID=574032 RepID=UPI00261DE6D8|nr:hypothetical protein [uncultured Lacinutrix sp.]
MKTIKQILFFTLITFALSNSYGQSKMAKKINKTVKASSKSKCEKKGGYWYNDKCWANFKEFDEGISIENIDAEVEKQLNAAKDFGLQLNGKPFNLDFFFPEINYEDNEFMMISTFTIEKKTNTLILITSIKDSEKRSFTAQTLLFNVNLMELSEEDQAKVPSYIVSQGTANIISAEKEDMKIFDVTGTLTPVAGGEESSFKMKVGEALAGLGDTRLEIKGTDVYLNGTLGTKGYAQFKDLIKNHPEITTIVLQNVPGSINDAVNMHTGRIIREAGLNTKVLANSNISSGGVDLFCAGKERIVTKGARLGIHSWGGDGISADDIAKDHPAHQYQLAYFTMCLGKEIGPAFYFRTLTAAPAGKMHWMSDKEIKDWKLATSFLKETKKEGLVNQTLYDFVPSHLKLLPIEKLMGNPPPKDMTEVYYANGKKTTLKDVMPKIMNYELDPQMFVDKQGNYKVLVVVKSKK